MGTLVHWAADDAGQNNDCILVFLSFHMVTTSIYTRIFANFGIAVHNSCSACVGWIGGRRRCQSQLLQQLVNAVCIEDYFGPSLYPYFRSGVIF